MDILKLHKIYFLGIGGVSMSGFAKLLHSKGLKISGYDAKISDNTKYLESLGIKIDYTQSDSNITNDLDLVVYSSAISDTSIEMISAKNKNITCISRSELISKLMKNYKKTLCISGTHGKTTTTAITSNIFLDAQLNPTISVGGFLPKINGVFHIGNEDCFILETCEYKNNFHNFVPSTALIMNIEMDHSDFFKSLDEIYESFNIFAKKATEKVIINKDIKNYEKVIENVDTEIITYSYSDETATYYLKNISEDSEYSHFSLYKNGLFLESYSMKLKGVHNIYNALASLVVAIENDVPAKACTKGLENFSGINRRFQYKGEVNDITVYDDYAHHPTACSLILEAVKKIKKNKLVCVFQPHTFSRTISLLEEFSKSFKDADEVIIIDIYPAREIDTGVINSRTLVDKINTYSKNATYISSKEECLEFLKSNLKTEDLLLTLGAGDVYTIGEEFIKSSNR